MSNLKTQRTDESVEKYLRTIENVQRRDDSIKLLAFFSEATGFKPALWGSIIGYGQYHYKSERSSQEGDWPLTGFSPRKANLTIYVMPGFKKYEKELSQLGKHKTSVSCLYINKLDDIDMNILKNIISDSVKVMEKQYNVA